MIAGLEDISEGELKIGDVVMNDVAQRSWYRDGIPNYALYPHMSVYDNMAFPVWKLRKYDKLKLTNVLKTQQKS